MLKEELAQARFIPGVEGVGLEGGERDLSLSVLIGRPGEGRVPVRFHGGLEVGRRRGLRRIGDVMGIEPVLELFR